MRTNRVNGHLASLERWRAVNRCDHGSDCPVWQASWLRHEDLEELGASGWTYPIEHRIPTVPPKRPRFALAALWCVAGAVLFGTALPSGQSLVAVLIIAFVYGAWAWCALVRYRQESGVPLRHRR